MSVLYIKEQGAYLEKRGERLVVSKSRSQLLDIPVANVENIAMIGNIGITTPLLHYLMEKGVDVSYFSYGGKYLGHTYAESSRNVFLRLAQYDHYQDAGKRIAMAKQIVKNKVGNQLCMIDKFRWSGIEYDWKADLKQLEIQQSHVEDMETTNQILGIEGLCSNIYFKSFGKMFKCKFVFDGRNRRPPRDPINVILSLGYTFLTREVSSALEAESFEMYLGFLHGLRYGRKSLALDMVEEFRQPVIDRLTLRLFNKGMLSEFDFETDNDAVTLNEDGFRTFCREYERWMTDKTFSGGEINFRNFIKQQALALKKAIQKKERYVPLAWRGEDVCD